MSKAKRFINCDKRETFVSLVADQFEYYKDSIVFIEDTREIWHNGKFYANMDAISPNLVINSDRDFKVIIEESGADIGVILDSNITYAKVKEAVDNAYPIILKEPRGNITFCNRADYVLSNTNSESRILLYFDKSVLTFNYEILIYVGLNSSLTYYINKKNPIDTELDAESDNAISNSAVTKAFDEKQETLVSGENIATVNGKDLLTAENIIIPTEPMYVSDTAPTDDTIFAWIDTSEEGGGEGGDEESSGKKVYIFPENIISASAEEGYVFTEEETELFLNAIDDYLNTDFVTKYDSNSSGTLSLNFVQAEEVQGILLCFFNGTDSRSTIMGEFSSVVSVNILVMVEENAVTAALTKAELNANDIAKVYVIPKSVQNGTDENPYIFTDDEAAEFISIVQYGIPKNIIFKFYCDSIGISDTLYTANTEYVWEDNSDIKLISVAASFAVTVLTDGKLTHIRYIGIGVQLGYMNGDCVGAMTISSYNISLE